MKTHLFVIITAILICGFFSSCSQPSTDAEKYISKETSTGQTTSSSNEVIDVTSQASDSQSESTTQSEKMTTEEKLKKTVSPSNYAKAIDQFAAAKKVWEKAAADLKDSGQPPLLFDLNDRPFTNSAPLVEMGGSVDPIPLFETWDISKLTGIEQVVTLVSNSTKVEILSRRRTDAGNWYLIKIADSGMEEIKGWLPEKLLIKPEALPMNIENRAPGGPQEGGGGGGRRGRRGRG